MQSSRQKVNTAGLRSCRTDSAPCFVHTYTVYMYAGQHPHKHAFPGVLALFSSFPHPAVCLPRRLPPSLGWPIHITIKVACRKTPLRKPARNNAPVDLHEDKFVSFSTSRHPLISSPATPVTSTNRKPVIQLDSGEHSPVCRHGKWSEY